MGDYTNNPTGINPMGGTPQQGPSAARPSTWDKLVQRVQSMPATLQEYSNNIGQIINNWEHGTGFKTNSQIRHDLRPPAPKPPEMGTNRPSQYKPTGMPNGAQHSTPYSSGYTKVGQPSSHANPLPYNPKLAEHPSVSVYCRGVQGRIPYTNIPVGDLGAQHCDAWVSSGDGKLHSISGGPDEQNKLRMWHNVTKEAPTGDLYFYGGQDKANLAKCLVKEGESMNSIKTPPEYHPVLGPNSNTYLDDLFSRCGVHLGVKTHGPKF